MNSGKPGLLKTSMYQRPPTYIYRQREHWLRMGATHRIARGAERETYLGAEHVDKRSSADGDDYE